MSNSIAQIQNLAIQYSSAQERIQDQINDLQAMFDKAQDRIEQLEEYLGDEETVECASEQIEAMEAYQDELQSNMEALTTLLGTAYDNEEESIELLHDYVYDDAYQAGYQGNEYANPFIQGSDDHNLWDYFYHVGQREAQIDSKNFLQGFMNKVKSIFG